MTFMKTNQDEHLDGFCRGCLSKYEDPDYLLPYTEKNRRLFVYSTGIQVKRDDAFIFQLCRDCYVNMKVSCRFKKQCRTSERRIKSFLRLKEVGEGTDFVTFLKGSQDVVKFPLSGTSSPVNQKKDEDNESICTSIRNFMTDILQGEEMPDTEARIIKEVIEEEADLLEDSLDSHWLHDDTPVDDRLDFSFSPYVTPRSVNNEQCFTPIKQIEPSLRCKNNHAKKVLLQLPTSQYIVDDHVKIMEPNTSIVGNNDNYKQETKGKQKNLTEKTMIQEGGMKFATEDSIAELIEQNEDFLIRDVSNDVNVKRIPLNALEIKSEIEKLGKQNEAMENIVSNITETESQTDRNHFPLTETDIAVKSINLNSYENNVEKNSYKLPNSESDIAEKSIGLNRYDNEARLSKDKYNLIETNRAVKSISLCGIENEEQEATLTENYAAVKRVNIGGLETESDDNLHQYQASDKSDTLNKDGISIKSMKGELPDTETDTAVISITLGSLDTTCEVNETQLITPENISAAKSVNFINDELDNDRDQSNLTKDDIAVNSVVLDSSNSLSEFHQAETNNLVKEININTCKKESGNENDVINELFEEIIDGSINVDHSLIDNNEGETQNSEANKQCLVDTIDKNLEKALKNETNTEFSLDDLLVSPTGVHTPAGLVTPIRETPTGMSTPTIQYLLFGDKDKEEGNLDLKQIKTEEVDVLEEFFKEGVKDFDPKSPKADLPLELRYDLQNAQCYMCNKTFGMPRALKIHLNKVHGIKFPRTRMGRTPGMCKHCGKIVDDLRNLARHVRIHNKKLNEEFKCDWCQTTFLSEAKFKVHLKAHDKGRIVKEEPVSKKYLCVECGAGFTSSSNLTMHKRRHTSNYSDICKVCNKGFYRASDLDIHFKRRHSGERPHKCVHCGKAFAAKYGLLEHIRKHTDQLPYQCHYCDKKFARKHEIIYHIHKSKKCLQSREDKPQARRGREPRFRCPYCPLAFSTKFNLVRHQNTSACWDIIKSRFEEPAKEVQITFENTPLKDLPVLIEE